MRSRADIGGGACTNAAIVISSSCRGADERGLRPPAGGSCSCGVGAGLLMIDQVANWVPR
jgi:hypothetical protein